MYKDAYVCVLCDAHRKIRMLANNIAFVQNFIYNYAYDRTKVFSDILGPLADRVFILVQVIIKKIFLGCSYINYAACDKNQHILNILIRPYNVILQTKI